MFARTDRAFALVAAVLAVLALLFAGVVGITVTDDDQSMVLGLFSVPGQWQLPLAAVVLVVAVAAVALRRARWAWVVVVTAGLAAIFLFGVGAAITADARDVEDAAEGGLSFDSPVSRAIGAFIGPATSVDTDDFNQIMIAAGTLELGCMAAAGWSLWAGRRRVRLAASPAAV